MDNAKESHHSTNVSDLSKTKKPISAAVETGSGFQNDEKKADDAVPSKESAEPGSNENVMENKNSPKSTVNVHYRKDGHDNYSEETEVETRKRKLDEPEPENDSLPMLEPPMKVPKHSLMVNSPEIKEVPVKIVEIPMEKGNKVSLDETEAKALIDESEVSSASATPTSGNDADSIKGSGDEKEQALVSAKLQGKKEVENLGGIPECDPVFQNMVKLDPIPYAEPLRSLDPREFSQLELALQIGDKFADHADYTTWRGDWNGNLQLVDKELIMNRDELAKDPATKKVTIPFCEWVAKLARHSDDFHGIRLLFSFVYYMKGTPDMAKEIMAYSLQRPASSVTERLQFIMEASRRISYDPTVLTQDGWTTAKSDIPDGHTGGSYLIGRRVFWHGFEAIVIAFVRDEDIGDLWKCFWIEDQDTFDLEADELQEGMKKWEKKIAKRKVATNSSKNSRPSIRFEANRNFTVDGIEDGIILAKSYKCKSGRPWPARIMHVTEVKALGNQLGSRRSSSRNEIHVVFLAPFWNGERNGSGPVVPTATSQYETGPLFELETIDVSSTTIQKYPYSTDAETISITNLRNEFSFLGLPKAAFTRFLDSHRMAMALKYFASKENRKRRHSGTIDAEATANLTDTHPLSIKTFCYQDAMLNLPFEYILTSYPDPEQNQNESTDFSNDECKEPIMQLQGMLEALTPPNCWNAKSISGTPCAGTPSRQNDGGSSISDPKWLTPTMSPALNTSMRANNISGEGTDLWGVDSFASEYLLKHIKEPLDGKASPLYLLFEKLKNLVTILNKKIVDSEHATTSDLDSRQRKLASVIVQCMTKKGQGEEAIFSITLPPTFNRQKILIEWRKACERIYKRAVVRLGHMESGNGVTAVLTDSRCNAHITANGSFERAVRLPAAIRGAKNAGVGSEPALPLITKIEDEYLNLAEAKILPMAHKISYLKRMKTKITSLPQDAKGVPLTDDSEGEGGEDTMGSRGSFTAAVTGVAAALKGVDMIIAGKCINAFCAVRPPGHHAGRELRPMNAISNGFCLLNAAAGAALYAASPRSQGGLGLNRVCVIDIDVHHGNGTQDILCSTYDPRFLYVSTHAGGAHINGYEDDSSNDEGFRRSLNTKQSEGIYPGRCGDTSPHAGVLNVPLGKKVTPSLIGTALVRQVTPAVEKFDPELIIISAGFDAHMNDPLGMGGLSAQDFGTVTTLICQMAMRSCSGRILSILEGGYGVPCCRPLGKDLFLPKLLDLGNDLPSDMEDNVDEMLAKKLDKCHQEGFLECVREHVACLASCSNVDATRNNGKKG